MPTKKAIYKISNNGSTVEKWFDNTTNIDDDIRPAGIAFDEHDNLYVASLNKIGAIMKILPDKTHGILAGNNDDKSIDNVIGYNGSLFSPRSLIRDKYGDIYVLGQGSEGNDGDGGMTNAKIMVLGQSKTNSVTQLKKHEIISNATAYQLANNERSNVIKSVQMFDTVDPNFNISAGEFKPFSTFGYAIGTQPSNEFKGLTMAMDALGNVYTPATESPWRMYKITPSGEHSIFLTHSNIFIREMIFDSLGNAYFLGALNGWMDLYKIPGTIDWWIRSKL